MNVRSSGKDELDSTRQHHGALPATRYCYACGAYIAHLQRKDGIRYYCSQDCRSRRPPKMVLAELAWGRPFADMALEHLNRGGSVRALADMCGVWRQTMFAWLAQAGIEQETRWVRRGKAV